MNQFSAFHYTFYLRLALFAALLLGNLSVPAEAAANAPSNIQEAAAHPQIIFVAAQGTRSDVYLYQKMADGHWMSILYSPAYIGRNGIGKTKEGDGKTPTGIFTMTQAFGIKENPGVDLPYTKVNEQHYWVDDSSSQYYNKLILKNKAKADWNSGEHIVDYPIQYAYAIAIDYNTAGIKNAGSGIFFHCSANRPTAGCIAIPENNMVALMQQFKPGCVISIDSAENIAAQIKTLP